MSENSEIANSKPAAPRKPASPRRVTAKLNKSAPDKKVKKQSAKVEPKVKVVRDSFTMPQSDYSIIGELKLVCLKAGSPVKKGELLRAGLRVLSKMSNAQLLKAIGQIEQLKTGRPKAS